MSCQFIYYQLFSSLNKSNSCTGIETEPSTDDNTKHKYTNLNKQHRITKRWKIGSSISTSVNSPRAARACPLLFHASAADGFVSMAWKINQINYLHVEPNYYFFFCQRLCQYLCKISYCSHKFSLESICCSPSY